MRGKSLALLVLALGCGLVASLGITQVLAHRGDQPAPLDTVPIYVAIADIPQGTLPGDETVRLEPWPKEKVPLGALTKQEEAKGRRAVQDLQGPADFGPHVVARRRRGT